MPRQTDDRERKDSELQDGRPAVTNRAWGVDRDPGDQSFGYEGQGGYGDFRVDRGEAAAHATRQGDAGQGPDRRPDERIRAVVADALAAHETLDANQVLVQAEGGVVTLTGEVREPWMRECAETVAAGVAGVREVRNCVRCDDGSASFGPPGRAVT